MTAALPLLTIAIPTWNRAGYLAQNLAQLKSELRGIGGGLVEIIVSDNCSSDNTGEVVQQAISDGMAISYVRNRENVGWARNFAQSFDLARGKYVLLFGDDDVFVDDSLALVMNRLAQAEYGVVLLRPYGFDHDFRRERPKSPEREKKFADSQDFLVAAEQWFCLTSACIINKSLIPNADSRQFITTDLAAFHLVLQAALAARTNLFVDRFLIGSKRQNSFGYEFAEVFVRQYWAILDAHGLSNSTIKRLERKRIVSYYPFYLFNQRLSRRGNLKVTYDLLWERFKGRGLFYFWLVPTIRLPRPLAILWGAGTTAAGRIAGGDFRRGLRFVWVKLMNLRKKGPDRHDGEQRPTDDQRAFQPNR